MRPTETLGMFKAGLPAKPYCSDDLSYGLRIRSKDVAVRCRYVQPNHPAAVGWLVFDIDRTWACYAWEDANLPCPTLAVINPANAHAHLFYGLETPVFNSPDRTRPLRYAAAIEAAMRAKLRADQSYGRLTAKNPLHESWKVLAWGKLYDLAGLASHVDLTAVPKARKEAGGLGRNCRLFDDLSSLSYRWIAEYRATASLSQWQAFLLGQAEKLNAANNSSNPLHRSETRAIARSVAKWTWTRFDIAASNARFSKLQAHRGRLGGVASGVVRRAGSVTEAKPWEADGISRATWYRRKSGLVVPCDREADA